MDTVSSGKLYDKIEVKCDLKVTYFLIVRREDNSFATTEPFIKALRMYPFLHSNEDMKAHSVTPSRSWIVSVHPSS